MSDRNKCATVNADVARNEDINILQETQRQLVRAKREVARLAELERLLQTNPETSRIIELMGIRH